jgi:hypothetical protein
MKAKTCGEACPALRDRAMDLSLASRLRSGLLSIACLSAFLAQTATAATIDVVPGWGAGHHDTLAFRHRIVARSEGKLVRDEDYRGRIEIKVEAKSPHGHYLQWTYRDIEKNGRPFTDALGLGLVMSADGADFELGNVAEVQRQVRARLKRGDSPATAYPGAFSRTDLDAFARDADLVERFYLKDVQMYFMPLGIDVPPTGHAETTAPLSPFGPWGTMHATERWRLEPQPSQPKLMELSWAQAVVPVAAAPALRGALARDFPFLQGEDGISTQGTFVLSRQEHWPLGVSVIRDSSRGTLRQVESWEFRSTRFGHLMHETSASREGNGTEAGRSRGDLGEQLAAAIEAARHEARDENESAAERAYLAEWTDKLARDSRNLNQALLSCQQETPSEIVATVQILADGSLDGMDVTASPCRTATDAFVQLAKRAAPFARPPMNGGVAVFHITRRLRAGTDSVAID